MAADQPARDRILRDLDTTLLVEAAAGTGKTTSLVGRMVELIATGRCEVGRLAAVTFTRKAAAELRGRFTAALEQQARAASGERAARLGAALAHSAGCFIGTIHSFCARLLRERPVEAGVDVAFREIDEDEDARLRASATCATSTPRSSSRPPPAPARPRASPAAWWRSSAPAGAPSRPSRR